MTLHLLPNLLNSQATVEDSFPSTLSSVIRTLDGLIAESPTEGRRFLKKFQTKLPPYHIPITDMNEDIDFILEPLLKGEVWGLLSDSGLPCVADPGSLIVKRARELHIEIKAYPGPSSIFMSLMLSGLPGQRFVFHGYIAKDPKVRKEEIVKWSKESKSERSTHIFIEAPHRNQHTLKELLVHLPKHAELVVASNLMSPNQRVECAKVARWNEDFSLEKEPTIFLFTVP